MINETTILISQCKYDIIKDLANEMCNNHVHLSHQYLSYINKDQQQNVSTMLAGFFPVLEEVSSPISDGPLKILQERLRFLSLFFA